MVCIFTNNSLGKSEFGWEFLKLLRLSLEENTIGVSC